MVDQDNGGERLVFGHVERLTNGPGSEELELAGHGYFDYAARAGVPGDTVIGRTHTSEGPRGANGVKETVTVNRLSNDGRTLFAGYVDDVPATGIEVALYGPPAGGRAVGQEQFLSYTLNFDAWGHLFGVSVAQNRPLDLEFIDLFVARMQDWGLEIEWEALPDGDRVGVQVASNYMVRIDTSLSVIA